MKSSPNVFIKILLALLVIGVVPVVISSLLIVSTYQDLARHTIEGISTTDTDKVHVEKDLLETFAAESKILVSIIVSISLIITLFLAVFLSKTFTLPLKLVTQAALELSRGDLSVRLDTYRTDEFGRLAEGFNTMAKTLSEAQARQEQAKVELERRVAERTAVLTMINNELRKSAEKIYESNRIKNEFLANMSHELRTPLNAILGYVDLTSEGIYGQITQKQKEALGKIRHNSQMLLRLINDILDLSQLESGSMPIFAQSFEPGNLVEETVTGVRPLFQKKGLDLRVNPADDLPPMISDEGKIQQVLLNLLSNSLKFTESGHVEVMVSPSKDESQMVFQVHDTGIGIATEFHDVIFDQFRQIDGSTARQYRGTGLGLSISRKIAAILDGEISVQSKPDEGSTFTLSLPIHYGQSVKSTGLAEEANVATEPVIVAIDDDVDALQLLSDNLKTEGYHVVRCSNGDSGVRKVKELLPFAITLDIMMPQRDGWSVLRELKSNPRTKNIPVIIISIIDDRHRGYQLGVNDYLVKPFNRRELVDSLRSFQEMEDGRDFGPV